jgi:hypothetical protein
MLICIIAYNFLMSLRIAKYYVALYDSKVNSLVKSILKNLRNLKIEKRMNLVTLVSYQFLNYCGNKLFQCFQCFL